LPGHAPLLGVLVDGKVEIKAVGGAKETFTINGGFLSVSNNRVSVLGQAAE
jgi:F-type H+-transporting ATPase subunit epsilon